MNNSLFCKNNVDLQDFFNFDRFIVFLVTCCISQEYVAGYKLELLNVC